MYDEPKGLTAAAVAQALNRHWQIDVASIEYAPVGFGSYHWIVCQTDGPKLFATADIVRSQPKDGGETEAFANLEAAYATASSLRDRGLEFVVAPLPDRSQRLLRRIGPEWAVAVFTYIDGHAVGYGAWSDIEACGRAAGLVGLLHASLPPDTLPRFDFALAHRESLFDNLDQPWTSGPYAERTRERLSSSRAKVQSLLAHYDRLVEEVVRDEQAWVITHGEPHSANFVRAANGSLYLIDWDTVRLAPRERDLAALPIDQPEVLQAYQSAAGHRARSTAALQLFRMWWDVSEICGYVHRFRGPHQDSRDAQISWAELDRYLQVDSNWPTLNLRSS